MSYVELTVLPARATLSLQIEDHRFRGLSGATQIQRRGGNRFELSLVFPPLAQGAKETLQAQVLNMLTPGTDGVETALRVKLAGAVGWVSESLAAAVQLNTNAAAGATQAAATGLGATRTKALVQGDYITIGDQLVQLTADVASASGTGTLKFWPALYSAKPSATSTIKIKDAAYGDFVRSDNFRFDFRPARATGHFMMTTLMLTQAVR